MNLPTRVSTAFLAASGRRQRVLGRLRRWMIAAFGDPPVEMVVHGHRITLPMSHTIPELLLAKPQHDRQLGRLADFLRERRGRLVAIDVGANVGDTLAAMVGAASGADDRYLAIDPNAEFQRFLVANWGSDARVTIVDAACGARDADVQAVMQRRDGTAVLTEQADGTRVRMTTLDALVREHPSFAAPDLLKIDTDGFDFFVLEGARGMLCATHPAVLFECDHFVASGYVERVRAALRLLLECGYAHMAAYDNVGYLMGCYSLRDTRAFEQQLFYQMASPLHFFDLLVLPDDALDAFLEREREHYVRTEVPAALADDARAVAPRVGVPRAGEPRVSERRAGEPRGVSGD